MPIPRPTCRLTITIPKHLLEGRAIELLEYVCEEANKAWPKLNKIVGGLRYANHSERIEYDEDGQPYLARMLTPQRRQVAANQGLQRAGFSIEKPHTHEWYLEPVQRGPAPVSTPPEPKTAPLVEETPDEPTSPPVPPAGTPDAAETPPGGDPGAIPQGTEEVPGRDEQYQVRPPGDPVPAYDSLAPAPQPPLTLAPAPQPQVTYSPKAMTLQIDPKATCACGEKGKWVVQDGKGVVVGESKTARGAWQSALYKLSR